MAIETHEMLPIVDDTIVSIASSRYELHSSCKLNMLHRLPTYKSISWAIYDCWNAENHVNVM